MRKPSKPLRRWWPLLAAAAVAIAAWGGWHVLDRIRLRASGAAQALAAPLASLARAAVGSLQPDDENARLRTELAVLRLEYTALQEQLDRERLRGGRLVFPDQRLAKLEPCALLFRDPATWFKGFSVDVGSSSSPPVREDAGVLNSFGVVGKLAQVGDLSSQVLLLSDPSCRFAARLARTGLQCAVTGDGRHGCLLQHLGGEDDVRVGDLVETGAGSRSFPGGVPVGTVLRLAHLDGGLRLQVEVEPAAPLNKIDGLYVWVGEPQP
jgi:rod shape-determining protein MreC